MRRNPVNADRWMQFKINRRGYWSLWIFSILFLLSLLAELWINDKPIMVSYQDNWYFPIVEDITEDKLGGDFDIITDYRDPYMVKQIEKEGWIIWPLVPFYYDSINFELTEAAPSPPDNINYLGTDDQDFGFIIIFEATLQMVCN